ncbi:uncharacterized protein LAESUDRAFT_650910 [Laetiporus sulphureus 93-53]|uniref:Arrestin-like N-terminal domain-containing protein n=1 Tax=Laetiporus sulphureus 93-53 TaxID=1314785 RepID=A0A165ERD7_9APHY|nr:uncharacterized protein LAESUDRAFT_650910 [Laetiporus sulphureus 93-53]KZT07606.1 hypothetical protein LAESUDRAFT_650910 [Laetiporus sulphureus 93-53]
MLDSSPKADEGEREQVNALPAYSPDANTPEWALYPLHNHSYFLSDSKQGQRWLTLDVRSRAKSAGDPPTFFQNGVISGTVSVHLEKEESFRSIEVQVTGRMTIFAHRTFNFLTMSRTLWPPSPSSPSGSLKGDHRWPFSFELPRGITTLMYAQVGEAVEENLLPPSVSDQKTGVFVEYQITVQVSRGKIRRGSSLVVPIMYTPMTRPGPPSAARQIAYQKNTRIPDAEADPEGWSTLPPLIVQGVMSKNIEVEAICTLSLAKPLCYTRGTALPLTLVIECDNEQALDLLATNEAIAIRLMQETSYGPDLLQMYSSSDQIETRHHEIARAVWTHLDDDPARPHRRKLAGEIHIPEHTAPRCSFLKLQIKHTVVLDKFEAEGFVQAESMISPLLSEKVEIATAHAPGPKPRKYITAPGLRRAQTRATPEAQGAPLTRIFTWPRRRSVV